MPLVSRSASVRGIVNRGCEKNRTRGNRVAWILLSSGCRERVFEFVEIFDVNDGHFGCFFEYHVNSCIDLNDNNNAAIDRFKCFPTIVEWFSYAGSGSRTGTRTGANSSSYT